MVEVYQQGTVFSSVIPTERWNLYGTSNSGVFS